MSELQGDAAHSSRWEGARVGVIYPGRPPISPTMWSGTPFGLSQAFDACGVEVVPIAHSLPSGVREFERIAARVAGGFGGQTVANRSWPRRRARVWTFNRQLRRAGALDAIIAMGTDMYPLGDIESDAPVVTYDDGNLLQMWRNPDSDIRSSGFSERHARVWIEVQSESIRSAGTVTVSTGWAARSMVDDLGVPADRVHIVGMGHRPRVPAAGLRDWSKPTFLFVGVEWRRKNGDIVLEAFERVRERHALAELHLVGQHDPVDRPGVIDHGYLPREDIQAQALLDELYSRATAFVLPSRFDPSPIAYLEAASAGLPVIATTEGGAGELIGGGAITVSPDDVAATIDAMSRLADGATAQLLGSRARTAVNSSTWPHVAQRILNAVDATQTNKQTVQAPSSPRTSGM